ncbi:hypothetical protein PENTCL1PPCAC_63, partial [Pristionchus entomophagus]
LSESRIKTNPIQLVCASIKSEQIKSDYRFLYPVLKSELNLAMNNLTFHLVDLIVVNCTISCMILDTCKYRRSASSSNDTYILSNAC